MKSVPEILRSIPMISVANLPPGKAALQTMVDQDLIRARLEPHEEGYILRFLVFDYHLPSSPSSSFYHHLMDMRGVSGGIPVAVFDSNEFEGFLNSSLSFLKDAGSRLEESTAPARTPLFQLIEVISGTAEKDFRRFTTSTVDLDDVQAKIDVVADTMFTLSSGMAFIYFATEYIWHSSQESLKIEVGIAISPKMEPKGFGMKQLAQLMDQAVSTALSRLGLKGGWNPSSSFRKGIHYPKASVAYESIFVTGRILPAEIIGVERDGALLIPFPVLSGGVAAIFTETFYALLDNAASLKDAISPPPRRTRRSRKPVR